MAAPAKGSSDAIDFMDFAPDLFHGPAAHLATRFAVEPGADEGIVCSDLLDPSSLFKILSGYYAARFPNSDRRSAASMWAQWYFGLLIPPLVLLATASGSDLPADPADLRLVLDDQNQPARFILTGQQAAAAAPAFAQDAPFKRMAAFTERHLSPLIFSLSARSGVSARVFWMNAAVVLDYTSDVLQRPGDLTFKPVTTERLLPDGNRNPLFGPYRPSGSEATRMRRVCCLRYNLECVERCADCPLKAKQPNARTVRPVPVTEEALAKSEETLS